MGFSELGLSPELLRAVSEAGYNEPTPIQAQAIPTVLMGRDVLGCAQTGTGKTASFTLPMIDILANGRAKARMPRSLIVEPTRELAAQVAQNFEKYGKYHNLKHALIIGGEGFADQEAKLTQGVDVLIATPGRLLDLFDRGKILLIDTKILVIDEADRMLDMGFIPDVERIVSLLPKIRQTLFFSATMAPEIRRLSDAFLMNPKEITVSAPATTATTVTQGLAVIDEMDKREALRRLIRAENVDNALIFCNRKVDVDILYKSLTKHGFKAVRLHGDMVQSARADTLAAFKRGEASLMVCSDVAARGIDIAGLTHVFNFDTPIHAEDYVHRIGRTGRAGREGRAFTFATPYDGKHVAAIQKLIGKDIPLVTIEGFENLPFAEGDGRGRNRGRGGRASPRDSGRRGSSRRAEPAHDAVTPAPTDTTAETATADAGAKPTRSRRRGRGNKAAPAAPAVVEAIIDAAIPHPSEQLHRHDLLEASTALPALADKTGLTEPASLGDKAGDLRPEGREKPARQSAPAPMSPVQPHDNRHQRRAASKASGEEEADLVAGHGFGDHLPAFLRRPVRLPAGDRRSAK
ncbi:superfamily II DNA/RNA helicase [Dongia mobilis]|uniref:DEAD-box ATP-dependent RNA helicase RhpA n=1 Tax=Dongia mobilis TaxID=578943 RepID=A0A4R6WCY3_9PROT|nr:DEAD/DEAH box helicase [Dongia mobilis]TDQ77526.1 superfamily II DNA/RNA helicase [Dongia mobilis]